MSDQNPKRPRDLFAEIAARRQEVRRADLVSPEPAPLPEHTLPLDRLDPAAGFIPAEKLDTSDKLRAELLRQREMQAPFLRDLASPMPETRIAVPIGQFDWRLQTEADRADFTGVLRGEGTWERVTIPHYGGPLGRATAYYRLIVPVSDAMLAKGALFVCFNGVDYKAQVFLNGSFLGSHEGFFAPFEFDCTVTAHAGENTLVIVVENDAICMGNESWGKDGDLYEGDKLYAATGPGYNDPEVGWHHCPPGMGIYQAVRLEARAPLHLSDLFVRPLTLTGEAEAWIEVWNCRRTRQDVTLSLAIYGRNFTETVIEALPVEQKAFGPGANYLRIPLTIPNPRVWEPGAPWLYQLQARVLDGDGRVMDAAARQFGMRTFRVEEDEAPKGRFFLNGREIRLRGANTMGFEQQDVIKGDWQQLVDDILLAKICHMNFWRLTQRPVQAEVYDYCDRLGLMTQTDLPLFGCLRRNQFCEAVRQAEEMERLVRSHPCNIMVSYVNEPFGGGMGKPHRHLLRDELERFFLAADQAVRLANPDRVIKAVDGDYDPPAPGFPDNHCYCGWYNGHGVDLGKLHKGYWQAVKPSWNYGCGEFGAEGLDPVETMRKYYPLSWLPQTQEEETTWTPNRIMSEAFKGCQTGSFYYIWFDPQKSVADWVAASQTHQAWVTRLMTEAFRRDSRMASFAIHLFIDAFPDGWMKAIMDVDRNPKPAYFTYRDALTPLMVNLRADRLAFFSGETAVLEAWICNDTQASPAGTRLAWRLEMDGQAVAGGMEKTDIPRCSSSCAGMIRFRIPDVVKRKPAIVRLALLADGGAVLHDTAVTCDVFPRPASGGFGRTAILGAADGKAASLLRALGVPFSPWNAKAVTADVVVCDDPGLMRPHAEALHACVTAGGTLVLLELPAGEHSILGETIICANCAMNPVHFVARATGHPLVRDFAATDFRFWFDPTADHPSPLLERTFKANGWTPILMSGNGGWGKEWAPALAAAEKKHGRGLIRVCNVQLANRVGVNPIAAIFARRLLFERGLEEGCAYEADKTSAKQLFSRSPACIPSADGRSIAGR